MNKNSNSYIILYASVMVVIVAAVLSFVSLVTRRYTGRERADREDGGHSPFGGPGR